MKNPSRQGQVRACGRIWEWGDYDGISTRVDGRFDVLTWRFGNIHQCKVFVHYSGSRDPSELGRIGMCLRPSKTQKEAMQKGLDWVKQYQTRGPLTPDELFPNLYWDWKTIYRTRLDILDHLFFSIGNGYSWLDGSIVPTDLGEREELTMSRRFPGVKIPENPPKFGSDECQKLPAKVQLAILETEIDAQEEDLPVGPLPDDGAPRSFYPICQYCNILHIPDDVKPEWLAVAYEAAVALRDRQSLVPLDGSGDPEQCQRNIAYGKEVVAYLEDKYPHLKTIMA